MTSVIYSLNGSLDAIINDNYSSAKAAVSPYIIDYIINKDKPEYVFNIGLDWKHSNFNIRK
jgi:hypothetical protein